MQQNESFAEVLRTEFLKRNNPTDLKTAIIGKVVQVEPVIVSISDGDILLRENKELYISEFFRLRCNIDKTGVLSSSVPSDTDNAESITETHSYTGSPCNMPAAISFLASAILGVRDELLNLKCNLNKGDLVVVSTLLFLFVLFSFFVSNAERKERKENGKERNVGLIKYNNQSF